MDPVLGVRPTGTRRGAEVPQSYPGCGGPNPSPADSHPGEIGPQIWAGRPGWTRLAMRHTVTSTGARVVGGVGLGPSMGGQGRTWRRGVCGSGEGCFGPGAR